MGNGNEERLEYLAKKWKQGTITPEEEEEYATWYNLDDESPLEVPASFASSRLQQERRIWSSILSTRKANTHKKSYSRWYQVAAAIVLLVLVSGSIFWFSTKHNSTVTVAKTDIKHTGLDALPGKSGAVLILANGQQIQLDSSGNGILTQQGNAVVTNTNGNLVYTNKTETQALLFNTLTTAKGQQFPLTLSDGTKVWLNAETSIRFPVSFQGKERSVEISGEAYFEVAHNAQKPFLVHKTGSNTMVRVLGTQFNINSYADEKNTLITLLEGSVQVSKGMTTKLLHPGWQADVSNDRENIQLGKVDVEGVMAWKNGYFSFDNTDLATVMRQLARWYDMDVIYQNGKVPSMTFWGGISRNSNLSQVLRVLEESNIKFRIEGRKLIVD